MASIILSFLILNRMKQALSPVFIFLSIAVFSQDLDQISNQILSEGIELYRNEHASWISTDSVPEEDKALINGYFTYWNGNNYISIYVDSTDQIALYQFFFQPAEGIELTLIKTLKNVPLTGLERNILSVRKKAIGIASWWYQQFGYDQIVNPNAIIYRTSPQFEVYVIPGAKQSGLLPIGGDMRMVFKPDGELGKMDAIHNNLIPFEIETHEEIVYLAHEHRGKRLAKEYITATDVCTLLLYREFLKEEKHLTVHKKFVSEFYFNEPRLMIRPNIEKLKLR